MSVPACVFVYVCLRPTGQCLRHGECAAHSCFSAHCRGRSGGWEDRLLTTSPFPPTPRPPFATGARCGWEERIEAERSPSPPHTSLFLNFTLCSCLLSSSSLSNSMCLSLSISVISFLSEWQRSLRFVISINELLTCGSALVEQQISYETRWLEKHGVGKSAPQENSMKWDCWVLWGSFEGASCQRYGSSDLYLVV